MAGCAPDATTHIAPRGAYGQSRSDQQPNVRQPHKVGKGRVYPGDLGGLDRWLSNVKCQHGGQSCEGEQCGEPGERAEELRQNCYPGETKGQKQEAGPRLAQSQKYRQPARVESPYGRNQEPPRGERDQTLVRYMRECWPCVID